MNLLAAVVGLFIMVSMPLTYFLLSFQDQETKAENLSRHVSEKVIGIIKTNPQLWRYMAVKFTQVFTESESSEIVSIVIYDSENRIIDQVRYREEPKLVSVGRTKLVYNNVTFGYVDLWKDSSELLSKTGILFVGSLILALILTYIIYHFPARIVKKAEEQIIISMAKLNNLSYFDQTTHLRNKVYLNEMFPTLIEENKSFSILFLDLDNFKHINDSYGHSEGDRLLLAVGERLQKLVRTEDMVCRSGGDEFIIVLRDCAEKESLDKRVKSFIGDLRKPFYVDGITMFVTASIGIAVYPQHGTDLTQLFKSADIAMYMAKKKGRNNYCYYSNEIGNDSLGNLQVVNDLHRALEKDEFVLYYQPKFDINNFTVTGCEILVRWLHPDKGLIYPGSFIHVAEESGLIVPIGERIIRKAFTQIKEWVDKYNIPPMKYSINISPHQFHHENLLSFIKTELGRAGLDPCYVELEITENVAMQNSEVVYEKLKEIKNLGLSISIDDFGTGYSSMRYLSVFPIDTLKIAMQFIQNIDKGKEDAAITSSIISLAHNMGIDVVAEGIETEEQLNILRQKKCDYGQGFLFSRPIPPDDYIQLLMAKRLSEAPLSEAHLSESPA
jgi:diguanylate cyclase (GGDEF)-like protein